MRLPTKPSQTPTSTDTLPMLPAHRHRRRDHRPSTIFAPRTFSSRRITLAGAEEVHADHALRPLGRRGDLVDVERRGVGGEHGAGLGDRVELGEDLLLDRHLLEHRLDDDVGVARWPSQSWCRVMSPMRLSTSAGREPPARRRWPRSSCGRRRGPRSSASCVTSTTVTGMPALAKFIAMPPPMVPAPMTAAFLIVRGRRVGRARRESWPPRARRRRSSAAPSTRARSAAPRTARARA